MFYNTIRRYIFRVAFESDLNNSLHATGSSFAYEPAFGDLSRETAKVRQVSLEANLTISMTRFPPSINEVNNIRTIRSAVRYACAL